MDGWNIFMSLFRLESSNCSRFAPFRTIIGKATSSPSYNLDSFRHPSLSDDEHNNGCKLGIDTWADTCCAGKHAYVEEFIEGKLVNATGFTPSLGSMRSLPIANVVYAHDTLDGLVLLLECNNSIYLGDDMTDSLLNPIQCEEFGVRIDVRPKVYYPSSSSAQTLVFQDGTTLGILYDGVLPYIAVRRPTKEELQFAPRRTLTSRDLWDPFLLGGSFSRLASSATDSNQLYIQSLLEETDPISSQLMNFHMAQVMSDNQHLTVTSPLSDFDTSPVATICKLSSRREDSITPEFLSKHLNIGLATAKRTLQATTHQCVRSTGLLAKRFKTDKSQLRYKQLMRGHGNFYCDYLKSSVKSIRGHIGGVLYTNKCGFKKFYPCSTESGAETGSSLKSFVEFVGLPAGMHSDNHKNFKEGFFRKILRKFGITATYTEPHSPWQNWAEFAIGEVKSYARRMMQRTNTPIRLWCFCYEYAADVLSLLASGRFELNGRTPYEVVMNYTPDISEYVSYSWFQWCWYYNEMSKEKELCRWLGPAHSVGQSFCSYVLLSNGEFIARSSVIGIPEDELNSDFMKQNMERFMKSVEDRIGNHKTGIFDPQAPIQVYYDNFGDDRSEDDLVLPYGDEIIDAKDHEIDEAYLDSLDTYIGAKVVVPGRDAIPVLATVRGRKRDALGNPIGTSNPNPILDSRIYELEFPDGRVEEFALNTILENLIAQTDDDGWDMGLLDEVVDFRRDPSVAISKEDGTITTPSGQKRNVITTKGWDVLIRWKDRSTNWVPLALIKESNPVEVAEAAVTHKVHNEPAFKWWTGHVLKKRERIISRLKSQMVRKGRMKFGIEIPGDAQQALALDKKNGNTFWTDAIKKEMKNSRVAFKLLERGEQPPVGYKEITCHLIFDIKLDMTRKARYVTGGHLTEVPTSMTYSSVVSRDTVRIGFLMAALNDLDILAGDIQNAFLSAPTKERIFFYSGDEWGKDKDRVVVVVRALYGLKSSALQFRNHLANTLGNWLGFKSSLADPDLWMKPETDSQGFKYYSYILVYVDDLLIIDKQPSRYMKMVQSDFTVKQDSIKRPTTYLGAEIGKVTYPDGSYAWTMGAQGYVKKVVKNVKKRLEEDHLQFNKKLSDPAISAPQPFSSVNYRPELDTSTECDPKQVTFYQNLIGILRWVVELGRIDIAFEVSLLSRYLVQPRTGHLVQALHIMKYLDIHSENDLAFDTAYHHVEDPNLVQARIDAMSEIYPEAKEELPPNAPEARGNPVQINCFVDSDHAGDRLTRRSQTGIIIYCNSAPIIWYSKRQTTVESSTFGAEFVALRIATELIISLRYKLRMFGIPILGHSNVFCDNESVYKNVAFAESTLKKKHNAICFHRVRECVAAGIIVVHKVGSSFNLSDILTKSLPAAQQVALRERIMCTV